MKTYRIAVFRLFALAWMVFALNIRAQSLINIDFGVGSQSTKRGLAGTGQGSNDFWNLFRFYDPKYAPGMPLVYSGTMAQLKQADGTPAALSITVSNAPGVWGNASGDPMYDSYIFAQNGSNIVVAISNLESGRYSFHLYGHADPDVAGEQNSIFRIQSGTASYGPLTCASATGWKASQGWQEGRQFVVFRDVEVKSESPVIIQVAASPNGVAVLNGLQISSKGTSPPRLVEVAPAPTRTNPTNLIVREVHYEGTVNDEQARFTVRLELESPGTNVVSAPLFDGDVAVTAESMPDGLRIARAGNQYRIVASAPGTYKPTLDVVARITRVEPWNQVSFTGPDAAIASISAAAESQGVELQLLNGTPLEFDKSKSRIEGYLSADRTVSLRWQSKAAEVTRKALITVETASTARVAPTVVRLTTELRYEILQAGTSRLTIAIPSAQGLTKLQGEQIRDWKIDTTGSNQVLTVEFLRPIEKQCVLNLFSEQPVVGGTFEFTPPQPLGIERESGTLTVIADDALVAVNSTTGARQISAPEGALAAYRFYGRPLKLEASAKRTEPVIRVADRLAARLEETRLLTVHLLNLTVEKAGIYALELTPQPGFAVAEVTGEGIEDWKVSDGRLQVRFVNRVLGERALVVQLEQALKAPPPQIEILPLRAGGAARETAQIGAAAAPGLRLKTTDVTGLTEIPVSQLTARNDELLAFNSQESDWKLTLGAERLPARINADIFNLITVGDGLVGGSATVRYTIINQGAQQFRLKVPTHWKNVEFTGSNIRAKEQQGDTWTINLQDKAWDSYTLVVTYDYQFDPNKATLDAGGLHALDAEHETGSVAITTAASVKLQPEPAEEPLHVIDPTELADCDRALITRPALLAYRYSGADYKLKVQAAHHAEERGLDAVADRTEITSVLTEAGEMLTQASFMVKNNDKQFQRFALPTNATFWGCYVNNQTSKAERDGSWLMVSLPRTENRDEAFAVDLVYAQRTDALGARFIPRKIQLQAPATDVPNTYAEWELYLPRSQRLSGFGGTMTIARGTTYGLQDAWRRFTEFYLSAWKEYGPPFVFVAFVVLLITLMVVGATRNGMHGLLTVLAVVAILAVLASMLLPALARAKQKAQSISAVNNLKQIGTALRVWSGDNGDSMFPASLDQCKAELGYSDRVLIDPASGEPFVYVGAGKSDTFPNAVIAYSPVDLNGRRAVLMGDGSVQLMSSERFAEALELDARQAAEYGKGRPTPRPQPAPAQPTPPAAAAVAQAPVQPQPEMPAPARSTSMAAGVRSIRIEIPRNGQPYTFTKVLNTRQEPLSVNVSTMSASVYSVVRSTLQSTAFLCGLLVYWRQRSTETALKKTVGLALAISALTALCLTTRLLHLVLIVAAPVAVVGLVILLAIKFWPSPAAANVDTGLPPRPDTGIPPVTACLALLLLLCGSSNAQLAPIDPASAPTIVAADYTGAIGESSGQFEGRLKILATTTNQNVALFNDDVAVRTLNVVSGEAKLLRQGNRVALSLPGAGTTEVEIKFVAKLGGSVGKRQLTFQLPSALSSRLSATIDEPEADIEFPAAVAFKRASAGQQTRVEATIGANDRVDLQWTPRVKRAAEIAATVFAENRSLVTVGGGVVDVHATFNYQISQGELHQARLCLPENHRLLRVEGVSIRTWELKEENGRSILSIDLLKGAAAQWQVSVETESSLGALPASAEVGIPRALDVKRENGLLAVRSSEEISLSVDAAPNLQRVDSADFQHDASAVRNAAENERTPATVYRFVSPDFHLRVKAEPVRPQIESFVRNEARIGTEQINLAATVDYTIKKAGIFGLKLALPAGYKVQSVSGENLQHWNVTGDTSTPVLDIVLNNRATGTYALQLRLFRNIKELSKTLSIPGVHPVEVDKLSGFVLIYTEPGIAVKTAALEGMVEIASSGAVATNAAIPALAYKFLNSSPDALADWKLQLATEITESWVRAEIAHVLTLSETGINGRALVRYDIQNAPVKEFRLKIPTNCANVEITGPNIRRRDQNGDEWRIELQNKVNGQLPLLVTWEEPLNSKTNTLEAAEIQTLDVERQTGIVVVKARPPLQVLEQSIQGELMKIDVREAPEWAGAGISDPTEPAVLAYRFVRPGYRLALQARRFEEAAVLQAMIDQANFTTVIASDGQVMTEMSLSVRNNGMQDLEMALPPDSQVWSAFVSGQPVHPAKRNGKLLVPLENFQSDNEAPVAVTMTYVGKEKFPDLEALVRLHTPAFDVPLKNARWDLYLPPDYDYSHFGGSMVHIADTAPIVQTYSLFEYRAQEASKKASRKVELANNLRLFNRQLASGNTKSINNAYSQLRNDDSGDEATRRELKDLQSNLRRIQGSNLMQAQKALGNHATGQRGSEANAVDVAEQQWSKLQQAQELAVAKIQPLHINLPTRGLHHAFNQVLQTAVQKPLTIEFTASNTQTQSWIRPLLLAAIGFLALWLAVYMTTSVRRKEI